MLGHPLLRILFVTEDDPLYVSEFFREFIRDYPQAELDVAGVVICRAFNESRWNTAIRVYRLYGPIGFGHLLLRLVLASFNGARISDMASSAGWAVFRPRSINAADFVSTVQQLNVDVIVSVAAPERFQDPLLKCGRIGCLNIHSGKLPDYRGMMPTFWQMLDQRKQATITIHTMTESLDLGRILYSEEVRLQSPDVLDRVIRVTKRVGAALMISALREIAETGSFPEGKGMTIGDARYFRFPDAASLAAFKKIGHRLL